MNIIVFVSFLFLCSRINQSPGMVLLPGQSKLPHTRNELEKRYNRATEPVIPLDVLFGEDSPELSQIITDDTYFSQVIEHMDASSLLNLLENLKEKYVDKADDKNKERVSNSFNRLIGSLKSLSSGAERSLSGPAEALELLAEENEKSDESEVYDEYYDIYSDEEEKDDDPSLLDFQSWNKKSGKNFWSW